MRNTAEQARRDMKLLAGLARFHLAGEIGRNRRPSVKVRIGINPITWTNDDVPELGGDTPLEVCLSETRQAGYAGTELGGKFPRNAAELKPIMQRYGLARGLGLV